MILKDVPSVVVLIIESKINFFYTNDLSKNL
jgi:hypothetical protein